MVFTFYFQMNLEDLGFEILSSYVYITHHIRHRFQTSSPSKMRQNTDERNF